MFGEVVIFFGKDKGNDFEYLRKQGMQLHSKMRYISAQFDRYLTDDLWKKNALHANRMAKKLAGSLSQFPQFRITQEVRANGVFCTMPPEIIPALQKEYFFHVWNEKPSLVSDAFESNVKEVRLMCSWDTTKQDIEGFVSLIRQKLG